MENLIKKRHHDISGVLATGTKYTAGMILISADGGANWTAGDVATDKMVAVLGLDTDATAGAKTALLFTGVFNENNITFNGTQTKATIGAILQDKNIFIEKWSK